MIGLICGASAGSYSTHIYGLAYVLREGETGPKNPGSYRLPLNNSPFNSAKKYKKNI